MANVSLKNISKSYDNNQIIKDISLEIKDKEFIVLVGASGCGKSTILRMIAGLEEITGGELYIGDKFVNETHPKDRDIAMVFQNYALYPHMNVYDNMAFGLKMRKIDKSIIDKKVMEAAEILGLVDLLKRKPKQLSGGQRQRVALGRAIVRDPAVFLMDEPLSNLDAKLRVQMRAEIKKLHQKLQTTFVYVTHDQVEALTMGDKIVILNKGEIQQADTPDNIYHKPENTFVAGFIGSPAMNFGDAVVTSFETINFHNSEIPVNSELKQIIENNNLVGKEVIFGIRPEHLGLGNCHQGCINVDVELVEMLGSEKLLHFKNGEKSFSAKLPADVNISENQSVCLQLDLEKIVLFDKQTQKRYR